MNKVLKNYILFILTGGSFWFLGFILAAATIYPWCFIGIILGPLLLFFGIIGWIKYREKDESNSFNNILSKYKGFFKYQYAIEEYFKIRKKYFFVLFFIFWISATFIETSVFKNSEHFKKTKTYIENDTSFMNEIGEIKYYGFLIGGSISSGGNAEISFTVIGKEKTINVNSKMINGKISELKY